MRPRPLPCALAALSILATAPVATDAAAQDPASAPAAETIYFLDVSVNGWPVELVARFRDKDGRLSLPADQFEGLGFILDETFVTDEAGERRVYLDQVPGLEWQVDLRGQSIAITAPFERLRPNQLRISSGVPRVESRADWGAMLAYDFFGEWSEQPDNPDFTRSASVNLDARLFSPWFTAGTTGYYTTTEGGEDEFVRLESGIDFDSAEHARRLRLGDSYTAGPAWIRPFRFGGLQWMRDYELRPDIVTTPMPELSQGVLLPSSVDLFINGVKRYSQPVNPGMVRLTDLPIVGGVNTVTMVVTDQAGRRTQVTLPLYSSTTLLAKGLTTFNVDAGVARQNYSRVSNDYRGDFGAAGFSYGVTDQLTVTGYAAGARDYTTAAGSAAFAVGDLFLVEAAALVSDAPDDRGWAWALSLERVASRLSFSGRYMESHRYRDLASQFGDASFDRNAIASVGLNMGGPGQLNFTYAMQREEGRPQSSVVSGTWSVDLFKGRINLSTTAYAQLEQESWGAFVSLSFPLGRGSTYAYVQESWRNQDEPMTSAQVRGDAFDQRLTWEVEGAEGDRARNEAAVNWDGRYVDLRVAASVVGEEMSYQADVAQSFVFMDQQLFVAGQIYDGFTVVDVQDSPGIRVELENRPVGRTNAQGRLFLADLQSYTANAISIDPLDLPADASIGSPSTRVAPRGRAGLITRFGVTRARSALVTLRMPDGTAPPVGAQVRIAGVEETTVAGFDGEIYVRGLSDGENRLDLTWRDGTCSATFTANVIEGSQPRLGPFTCAP